MASGANLASLYVGLELMALSVYVLVGYFKLEVKSNEGAVKYFVVSDVQANGLLNGWCPAHPWEVHKICNTKVGHKL